MNDNDPVTYAVWKDWRTGAYEVVRWKGNEPTVMQGNILSRGKAMAAADIWRQREKEKQRGAD